MLKRIMVVDSNPDYCTTTADIIHVGHPAANVYSFSSSAYALTSVQRTTPDAVLVGCYGREAGDGGGLPLVRDLRKQGYKGLIVALDHGAIRVVNPDMKREAKQAGATRIVPYMKPSRMMAILRWQMFE